MGKTLLVFLIGLLIIGTGSFFFSLQDDSPTITGEVIKEKITEEVDDAKDFVEDVKEDIQEEVEEAIDDWDDEEETDGEEEPEPEPVEPQYIKIANFNAQIFGDSKWERLGEDFYAPLVEDYDIFFLQEIRDKDGSSFNALCNALEGYQCDISSRAGRSTSKEQYGIIYKDGITATLTDYNPDEEDRWERPPVKVEFNIGDYELIVWNIHAKPDDVENEINALEDVVENEGNVIILGDLNLDCNYDDGSNGDFEDWNYLIRDNDDTTVKSTNCAYDRIILNDGAYEEFEDYGIYTEITEDESDHYLVWVELDV